MPLRRCFSSLGCPELSLDEVLALAAKHDIPFVELRSLGGSVDLPAYFSARYGTPTKLAARFRESKVRVAALNASLHLVGGTAQARDDLVALAPWADALGVKWLRVFDGGQSADATEFAEAGATLKWWRSLRLERGWTTDIMIETHDSLITGETISRFVTTFPATAILWDAHHTWRKGREEPEITWRSIRRSVVHVHVKDSTDVPSARHPFTYVLPGDGEFPIAATLRALRADDFDGPVSLEWEKQWHPYLPSLERALATAVERNWW